MARVTNAQLLEAINAINTRVTALEQAPAPVTEAPATEPEPGSNTEYLRDQKAAMEQAEHMIAKCQSWCGGGALTGNETRTFYAVPAKTGPSGVAFRWYSKVPRNGVKVAEINAKGEVARYYPDSIHFGLAAA